MLEHDRPNCIGCGACAAVTPEFWVMDDDGKSDIKNSKHIKNEKGEIVLETLEVSEADFPKNKEAAESCPVNVIHIKKDNEKII
ncbi:ferredoxin [Candidatus Woesearchaeota archaeon]|nr:ferredoxin [Candidatus Woesearchaeota archaeon]